VLETLHSEPSPRRRRSGTRQSCRSGSTHSRIRKEQLFFGHTQSKLTQNKVDFPVARKLQNNHVGAVVSDDFGDVKVALAQVNYGAVELTSTNILILNGRLVFSKHEVIKAHEVIGLLVYLVQGGNALHAFKDFDLVALMLQETVERFVCVTGNLRKEKKNYRCW